MAPATGSHGPTPSPAVAPLREKLEAGRRALADQLDTGGSGVRVARGFAKLTDEIVLGALAEARELHDLFGDRWPEGAAGELHGLAVLAQGGYGRMEMSPYSDVDLLFLHDDAEATIGLLAEHVQRVLWNLGLTVGAAVRSVDEQKAWMARDRTIMNAFLDSRVLVEAGSAAGMAQALMNAALSQTGLAVYVNGRRSEVSKRRERYGDSVFLLEPDVKMSEGGLRDVHEAEWIRRVGHYLEPAHAARAEAALSESAAEISTVRRAHAHLLTVRHHLHFIAGKRTDRLTFQLQEQAAARMGYRDQAGGSKAGGGTRTLGVERFMRSYYRSARVVKLYSQAVFDLYDPIRASDERVSFALAGPLSVRDGRVHIDPPEALRADPPLIVEVFAAAAKERRKLSAATRLLVARAAPSLIRAGLRRNPRALSAFWDVLAGLDDRGEALSAMHELGVLPRFIPEFARVNTMVIHDVYHVYTVDEHTLHAISRLKRLIAGELRSEVPLLTRLASEVTDPLARRTLFLAVVMHDIAKKSPLGAHSEVGAVMAQPVGERLGLPQEAIDDVAFLVRQHLAMSHVAQRRDISDPAQVADFAARIESRRRLALLYLLTYVDVASVGPNIWNSFKAGLLQQLFLATDAWLENQSGIARPISGAGREGLEKLAQAFTTEQAKRFIRTLPGRYIDATPVETIEEDYRRYGEYNESRRPVAEFSPSVVPGHAVFHIVARDRPGFLFKVSGVLASFGVSVHSAQINTTTEGVVLNRFDVEKVPDTAIERLSLAERIARRLEDVLEGKADLDKLLAERRKARKFAPPTPDVRTDVVTNINDSQRFTIVEITTRDRVALLHDIARAFNGWGADISLAMIDTQGNRAVDTFYVTDRSGKKIADPARLASLSEFLVKTVAAEG